MSEPSVTATVSATSNPIENIKYSLTRVRENLDMIKDRANYVTLYRMYADLAKLESDANLLLQPNTD